MGKKGQRGKYKLNNDYLRNIIFGAEDSLVSTVGVTFGLAASGKYTPQLLVLAGVVLIAVEALSMGAGSYLTESEIHEVESKSKHKDSTIVDGLIMFFSYLIFGGSVLLPYILFEVDKAKYVSVGTTLFLLFAIGYLPTKKLYSGIRMFIIAGLAMLVGFFVSTMF
jgi:VIT1/CCC1 family predicted Fe2+/Mn2+ transporter